MPQSYDFNGPLSSLDPTQSQTAIKSFFYPANLTTATNHYIRFDANIFEDSRFQGGIEGNFSPTVDAGLRSGQDLGVILINTLRFAPSLVGGNLVPYARNIANQLSKNYGSGGPTTAALNYMNSLPDGDQFYNIFPGLRGIGNKRTLNHMYLYTPDTMTFDYNNKWEAVSLRDQFGIFADGISAMNELSRGNLGAAALLAAHAGSTAAAKIGLGDLKASVSAYAAMKGFPVNPLFETLYKSTQPRQFKFQFSMYPQTQKETEEIYNIVEQFAFHAAPEYAASEIGGFMIIPSTFDIKFMFIVRDKNGGGVEIENPWIRRISTCALTSFNIDYSPGHQWQAMEDGSPRALNLSLEFVELEVMTKDRIKRGF